MGLEIKYEKYLKYCPARTDKFPASSAYYKFGRITETDTETENPCLLVTRDANTHYPAPRCLLSDFCVVA